MPYPFTRPEERSERERPVKAEHGLRVTYPNNVTHWFPGPEPLAAALARRVCPEELFNHPGTTLEYGERCGTMFTVERHLAGPLLSKSDGDPGPRVISPDPF